MQVREHALSGRQKTTRKGGDIQSKRGEGFEIGSENDGKDNAQKESEALGAKRTASGIETHEMYAEETEENTAREKSGDKGSGQTPSPLTDRETMTFKAKGSQIKSRSKLPD